nr:LacI family DNA-binding transcriptional regulator [Micromonospora sp. DSM 115978]
MKDVAIRAQVSLGTVSNVLNRPDVVAERTRARVLEAIAELGFVRNESARQLRAGISRTLAYVVLDSSNPYFTDVGLGVQEVADAAGLVVYLCNSGQEARRQATYLDVLEQQRVGGVLITPVDDDDPLLTQLPQRGTPVVIVDGAARATHCSVTTDDLLGGDLAASHLLDVGHSRIVFVGPAASIRQVDDRRGRGVAEHELAFDLLDRDGLAHLVHPDEQHVAVEALT